MSNVLIFYSHNSLIDESWVALFCPALCWGSAICDSEINVKQCYLKAWWNNVLKNVKCVYSSGFCIEILNEGQNEATVKKSGQMGLVY